MYLIFPQPEYRWSNVTRKMEKSSATSDVGLVISTIVRSFIRLIGESVLFLLVSKKCYIFGQVVRFVQKEQVATESSIYKSPSCLALFLFLPEGEAWWGVAPTTLLNLRRYYPWKKFGKKSSDTRDCMR